MKKGTQIKVTDSADYNGQDMNWTETYAGKKVIGKGGETVYHQSDRIIKMFVPKEICVHPSECSKGYFKSNTSKKEITSEFNWKTYLYSIHIPEGTVVDTYSDDEYRFELTDNMKVIFVGTIYEAKKETIRKMTPSGLKEITTYLQYSEC